MLPNVANVTPMYSCRKSSRQPWASSTSAMGTSASAAPATPVSHVRATLQWHRRGITHPIQGTHASIISVQLYLIRNEAPKAKPSVKAARVAMRSELRRATVNCRKW